MSRAKRRRNKKARKASQVALAGGGSQNQQMAPTRPAYQADGVSRGEAIRPTSERMGKGTWAEPTGTAKSQQPIIDLAHDRVGLLHCEKQITDAQEQTARAYQELHARYMDELPEVSGYKSCLAGGSGGYDAGDGNAAVIAEYRRICRKAGMIGERELYNVCVMGDRPRNIMILRRALDDVSA